MSVFILRQIPWPTTPSQELRKYAESVLEKLSQNPHMTPKYFESALEDDVDAKEVFDMFSREPPFVVEHVFWKTLRAEIKVKDEKLLCEAQDCHILKKNIPTPVLDDVLYGIWDKRLGLLKFEIQHGMRSLAVLMCCLVVDRFPWLHIPLVKAVNEGMKASVELATAFISGQEAEELLYQRDMNRFDLDAARARSDSLKRAAQEWTEQSQALEASLDDDYDWGEGVEWVAPDEKPHG